MSFGEEFASHFGADHFGASQPDFSQTADDSYGQAPSQNRADRESVDGILTCTIASIQRCYQRGSADLLMFGKKWQLVVLVGLLRDVEDLDGDIWEGMIDDGTGRIPFRYEVRLDMKENYTGDIARLRPSKENFNQWPAKVFGVPQVIDQQVCLIASFLRPADRLEYAGTHYLEAARWALLLLDATGDHSTATKATAVPVSTTDEKASDPYNDAPIKLKDADMADYAGSDRLKNVVCKYLEEQSLHGSEIITATIRSLCHKKWSASQVNEVLEELVESGLAVYIPGSDKGRIELTDG